MARPGGARRRDHGSPGGGPEQRCTRGKVEEGTGRRAGPEGRAERGFAGRASGLDLGTLAVNAKDAEGRVLRRRAWTGRMSWTGGMPDRDSSRSGRGGRRSRKALGSRGDRRRARSCPRLSRMQARRPGVLGRCGPVQRAERRACFGSGRCWRASGRSKGGRAAVALRPAAGASAAARRAEAETGERGALPVGRVGSHPREEGCPPTPEGLYGRWLRISAR
jgi:hypothetical protein